MENITAEEKEFLEKQLKKFQDQTKSASDIPGDNVGSSKDKVIKLDKVPGSDRLSYYQVKQYYQNLINQKKGGEM